MATAGRMTLAQPVDLAAMQFRRGRLSEGGGHYGT
jgi:hypothetical protein